MLDAAFLAACAPMVHPATMAEVIRVESAGDPLAINVNRYGGKRPRAMTIDEAVRIAEDFIRAGYRVDVGVAQVTDRNLAPMGLSVRDMFDPCKGIRAGGTILAQCYARAVQSKGEGQAALHAALSCYNTGSLDRGLQNGYVAKYVPALSASPVVREAGVRETPKQKVAQADPPAWGNLVAQSWDQTSASGTAMTLQQTSW